MQWSRANTEYGIHRVQYTPSTAYTEVLHTLSTASTQECVFSLHSHDYELTPECSFCLRQASQHDRPPSASSPWQLKGKVPLSHSDSCEITDWSEESQHLARHPSTASKYLSKLTRLRPKSSHDYGLQVHLQTRSITTSKHARCRPPSVSANSLDYSLQVYLQTCSITASNQARSRPPSSSPNSHDCGLQVHLQTRTIAASKCISLNSLAHGLHKCIYKLTWLRPPNSHDHGIKVHLQPCSITISKCISKYARLPPLSQSPNSLNHGLGVYLWVHSIVIVRGISNSSEAPPAASPDLSCVDG